MEIQSKKKRYVPISERNSVLPPLPSTSTEPGRTKSRCRYHCGYECVEQLILTHQKTCFGHPRREMDDMPGIRYNYTCNYCGRTCHRMFDVLKHFKFGLCLPELPPLLENKRKREWPITVEKSCYHCGNIFSGRKSNIDRHFKRKSECNNKRTQLIAENNSFEVTQQIEIDEVNSIDPIAYQTIFNILPAACSKRKLAP